jgi:hypothetical protein
MIEPKVGAWYQDTESFQVFEVISVDDDFVEIQYNNGDIGEFSLEDWEELHLVPAGAPDDWSMVWEMSDEDRPQTYHQVDLHAYKEPLDQDQMEDSFHSLSHEMDESLSDED